MYDWSALLTNYFRQNLDPASGHTLYIVIKSYWMQEGILDEITTKKVIQRSTWDRREPGGTCKAALDIYIQADAYLHPFFKIDDVFLNFNKFSPRRVNEWIFLPFDSMARKIMASDIATVLTKKKNITIAQTDSFYTKRFDLPILKTTALLKGIYLTFQDFINNKIMAADFRWQNGTITDELYLVQNGTESLVTEFWGFSDGKTLFIKSGFNIYPAIRRQNTFEVFGAKHITNYHNNASPNDLIKINSMSVDRKILQLSMETGKFY
jgi:hypothetical protein